MPGRLDRTVQRLNGWGAEFFCQFTQGLPGKKDVDRVERVRHVRNPHVSVINDREAAWRNRRPLEMLPVAPDGARGQPAEHDARHEEFSTGVRRRHAQTWPISASPKRNQLAFAETTRRKWLVDV